MFLEQIQMKEEKALFYSDTEENRELGCIGHLRGDFGRDGKEFWATWHPHLCEDQNNEQFKIIFDAVINRLREPGAVLCNRGDMYLRCRELSAYRLDPPDGDAWGFRIWTQDYAIYLRCMPHVGGYNFYAYCYDKAAVMKHLAGKRNLPPYSYAFLPTTGEHIRIDIAQRGYTSIYKQGSRKAVSQMNKDLGITPAQAEAMKAGSMFGWEVPAADPKSYDGNGKPIRRKDSREDR